MSEKRYQKYCRQCGKTFTSQRSDAKFCTGKCRARFSRDKKDKLMENQTKEIESWKSKYVEEKLKKRGRPKGSGKKKSGIAMKKRIEVVPDLEVKVGPGPEVDQKPVDFTKHTFDELNRAVEEKSDYRGGYYHRVYIDRILTNEGVGASDQFTTGKYSFEKTSEEFYMCIEEKEAWIGINLEFIGHHT